MLKMSKRIVTHEILNVQREKMLYKFWHWKHGKGASEMEEEKKTLTLQHSGTTNKLN